MIEHLCGVQPMFATAVRRGAMESLQRRLRASGSPIADSAEAVEQLRRQLDSVLDDVEHLTLPVAGVSAGSPGGRLSAEIGTARASQGVHPVESANAAVEMFQVLLPLVTEELGARGVADAVETAAVTLHRSIMRRVGYGALSYANYLLQKVTSSHRDERRRIARDLHDSAAHAIGVALQNLELHDIYQSRDKELADTKFALARTVLHEALATVRQTAQVLHGAAPDSGGLEQALHDYLASHVPDGIDATACVTGDVSGIPDGVCEELFIVLREAVRNAVLHSGAHTIRVRMDVEDDEVHATVEDDGDGFEVARKVDSPSGIGLLSMRERVELLAGTMTVTSADGQGTTVSIVAPGVGRYS